MSSLSLLVAGAGALSACNMLFGINGGQPGVGGAGGATSSTAISSTTSATSVASSTSGSTSSTASSTASTTSTGMGGTGGAPPPKCDGTDATQDPGSTLKIYGQHAGGTGIEQGLAIALKPGEGNVLMGATYQSADTTIAGNTLPYLTEAGAGGLDSYVARYTPAPVSNLELLVAFTGPGDQVITQVTVDGARNNIVAGWTRGPFSANGVFQTASQTPVSADASSSDVIIAKLDQTGGVMWAKAIGGAQNQMPLALVADGEDTLVLFATASGSTPGPQTVDFGCGGAAAVWTPDLSNGPTSTLFLARYDTGGACVWQKRYDVKTGFVDPVGTPGAPVAMTMWDGTIYLAGGVAASGSNVDTGPTFSWYGSGADVFAAAVDDSGNHIWSRAWGGTGKQWATGVGVDPCGNVVLGGTFLDTVTFDDVKLTDPSNAGQHGFVVRLDPGMPGIPPSTVQWSSLISGPGSQEVTSLAVNGASEVAVGGNLKDTPTIQLGSIMAAAPANPVAGSRDGFVFKLDGQGHARWAHRFACDADDTVRSVSLDDLGHTGVSGDFAGTCNFGFTPAVATGPADMYWLELTPP